ncbi:MAG: DUF1573 domain-containing protein [Pirellulales bacterium]|nr:DUF1573 domain-containing protein [Pirellulales bacterium]
MKRRSFRFPLSLLLLLSALLCGVLLGTVLATVNFHAFTSDEELFGVKSTSEDPRFPAMPPAHGPQPRVVVENGTSFDFGQVETGVLQRHGFIFKNIGQYPLRLRQGTTTCKCTISNIDTEEIAPGKTAVVTLEWEVKGTQDEYRQIASIYTNDPLQRMVKLEVTGRRQVSLYATPHALTFSKAQDETLTLETTVHATQAGAKIVSLDFTDPKAHEQFELAYEPVTPNTAADSAPTSDFLVRATTKPGLPLGAIQQTIRVTTDLRGVAPLDIKLSGTVNSDISVVGAGWNNARDVLELGTVQRGVETSRKLLLLVKGPHRDEVEFTVEGTDPPPLVATLGGGESKGEGRVRQFPLTITVPADCPTVNRQGTAQGPFATVRLKTTHPSQPELVIHVRFVVEG